MHSTPILVTAPAEPLVTVAEMKERLRILHSDDDAEIQSQIDAAISYFDGYSGILGRCLVNQEWRVELCEWPAGGRIGLPFPQVSAAAVTFLDADEVTQTVDSGLYSIGHNALGSFIAFNSGFDRPTLFAEAVSPISVTFTAGYGSTSDEVPGGIRQAVKYMVAQSFEHRDLSADINMSPVHMLVAPYRRYIL